MILKEMRLRVACQFCSTLNKLFYGWFHDQRSSEWHSRVLRYAKIQEAIARWTG